MTKWETAKNKFDKIPFPTAFAEKQILAGETHKFGNANHALISNEYTKEKHNFMVDGYEVEYKYKFCDTCKQTIKRYGVIFNDQKNSCFMKEC